MKLHLSGEVARVFTEHTYVEGFEVRYFGDEQVMDQVHIMHLKLTKMVGDFYGNHYAFELKVTGDSSIYIGINDGELTIGSKCYQLADTEVLLPKENVDTRLSIFFK